MGATKVTRLQQLRAKVLHRLPQSARAEIQAANQKNAEEFVATVEPIIPRGDPANGNLVDTLVIRPGDRSSTAVVVSIGDKAHPHPLHLEAGHRNKDGTHTPAKPYWNPAKRVVTKRAKGRASRAANKAIKAVAAST